MQMFWFKSHCSGSHACFMQMNCHCNSFACSNSFGSALNDCEHLPICQFAAVPGELPKLRCSNLSTDQRYCTSMRSVKVSQNGTCSPELARRNPGRIAHSRWLMTGNRILRINVSTANP